MTRTTDVVQEQSTSVRALVETAPKAEVHLHVEGTIDPEFLFVMAERNGVALPYDEPADVLKTQQAKKQNTTENLKNFLDCLDMSRGAIRTSEDYFDISNQMFERLANDNVVYTEVFFDPQQGIRQGLSFDAIVEGLQQSQQKARKELGLGSKWIMCFQRDHPADEAFRMLEFAKPHRDFIVGVGLDNFETKGFTKAFSEPFNLAREQGYRLTSHCDVNQPETYDNIKGCLDRLGVSRIDHGLNVVDFPDLLEQVIEDRIGLTGCATYYVSETAPHASRIEMFRKLLEAGALISINSDDPAQFGSGWINRCLTSMQDGGGFNLAEMQRFLENAFHTAWLEPGECDGYLQRLREHFVPKPDHTAR